MKRYSISIIVSVIFLFLFFTILPCEAGSSQPTWTPPTWTPPTWTPPVWAPPDYASPQPVDPPPGHNPNDPNCGDPTKYCPTKDYCGPKILGRIVPDAPIGSEDKHVFGQACYLHDECYANRNCDNTRIKCDAEFVINLAKACGENYYTDLAEILKCDAYAAAYLAAVRAAGPIFYNPCVAGVSIKDAIVNSIKAFNAGDIPTIFDVAHSAAQYLPDGSTIALSGSVGVGANIGKAGGAGIDLVSQGVSITHAKDGKTIIEFPLDIGPEGSLDFIVGVSGGAQLNSTGYIEISADGQTYALGRKIGAHTDVGVSLSTPTPVISGGIETSWQPYAYENFQITMPKSKWEELPLWERRELLREVRNPDGTVTMVAHGKILDAFNSDVTTDWSFESGITKYDGVFISAGGGAGLQGKVTASFGYETEV